jgi:O-antigen/teichoic acid export membrane protein
MSLLRKLAGETAIYGFSYILSRVLHYLVFTWYLTRVFNDDTSQYGIYRDLYFYVAIILVLLTFRMETTYFRYAREDRPAVTAMSMTFLTLLAGLFLTALWLWRDEVARWMEYPQMTTHLMMLGGVLFFDTLSAVPFASLRQQNRPVRFLMLKLGSILLNIIMVLFFIEIFPRLAANDEGINAFYSTDDKLFYIILSNLLASLITFVLLLPLMRNQLLRWDMTFLKRMLRYSWPLVIVAFAGVINQYSSIAFQKYLLPDDVITNLSEGGIYAAAASLAIILSLFTTAFNYAAEPFFFAHKEREDARPVYADVALAFTIIGSVMMLLILAYIDLFQLLLGRNFRQGLEVVPILLISFLLLGVYYNVSAWYKLADKTLWGAWIAGIGTLITIALSFILIPTMGVIGSAWTALACYLFMVVSCYVLGQKYYPIPYKIWRMIGWMGGSLLMYFIMEGLRGFYVENLGFILLTNSVFVGSYLFLIYFLEKPLLRQLTGRIK